MEIPLKRVSASAYGSFRKRRRGRALVEEKYPKQVSLSEKNWLLIITFLDTRSLFVHVPLVNKYFYNLVKIHGKGISSANALLCTSDSLIAAKSHAKNTLKFRKFFAGKHNIKKMTLTIIKQYNENILEDVDKLPFLNTVNQLKIKTAFLEQIHPEKFLTLFTSLRTLKLILEDDMLNVLPIFDIFFKGKKILSSYMGNKDRPNLLVNLEELSICVKRNNLQEKYYHKLSKLTQSTQLKVFSLKSTENTTSLPTSYPKPLFFSLNLIKLKLPATLIISMDSLNNLCLFLTQTFILKTLNISSSVLNIHNAFMYSIAMNKSLNKLHLLETFDLKVSIQDSINLFASVETSSIEDFRLITDSNDDVDDSQCYMNALSKLLSSSNIKKIVVNLREASYDQIKTIASFILFHAENGKLECFMKYNLKNCIINKVYFPEFSYSNSPNYELFSEIFKQMVKNPSTKLQNIESEEQYLAKLKAMVKDSANDAFGQLEEKWNTNNLGFFCIVLAMKFNNIQLLDLKNIKISMKNPVFLEIIKHMPKLTTLKLHLKNSREPLELLETLSKSVKNLASLSLDFSCEIVIWTNTHSQILSNNFTLSKLSLNNNTHFTSQENPLSNLTYLSCLNLTQAIFLKERFAEFTILLSSYTNLTRLKLDNIQTGTSEESDNLEMMQNLLAVLANKSDMVKIFISFNMIHPNTQTINREAYEALVFSITNIFNKNLELEEFSALIPVYNIYLFEYSIEMMKLIDSKNKLRKINSYDIKTLRTGPEEETVLGDDYAFLENIKEKKFSPGGDEGLNKFFYISPIILAELLKAKFRHAIWKKVYKISGSESKLEMCPPYDLNPCVFNIFLYSFISCRNMQTTLVIGNTNLSPLDLQVLAYNLGGSKVIRLELRSLVLKMSEIDWILSSHKAKSLVFTDVTFKIAGDYNKFSQAFEAKITNYLSFGEYFVEGLQGISYFQWFLNVFSGNKNINKLKIRFKMSNEEFLYMINVASIFPGLRMLCIPHYSLFSTEAIKELIEKCCEKDSALGCIKLHKHWWDIGSISKSKKDRLELAYCELGDIDLFILSTLCEMKMLGRVTAIDLSRNYLFKHGLGCYMITIMQYEKLREIDLTDTGFKHLVDVNKDIIFEIATIRGIQLKF